MPGLKFRGMLGRLPLGMRLDQQLLARHQVLVLCGLSVVVGFAELVHREQQMEG